MRTRFIALASALVATAAFASAAEAGGGIRLGFGVPLGSFVATPAHGGGAYHAKKARKAPSMQAAARKPQKPAPRLAKAEPKHEAAKETVVEKTVSKAEDTAGTAAPVTGSSALIQGSIPNEAPAAGMSESAGPDVKAEAPAGSTVTAHSDHASEESEDCKKFIPAVGMTVSVGCE
ncbi:MAG: hypothetical protein J0H65_01045 [Rhizobiales bacterium]|nr:hypothetical protein [Hyphomicrobiales bacterium]